MCVSGCVCRSSCTVYYEHNNKINAVSFTHTLTHTHTHTYTHTHTHTHTHTCMHACMHAHAQNNAICFVEIELEKY